MTNGLVGFCCLLCLMLLGVPIGFSMGIVGFVGFTVLVGAGPAAAMTAQIAFDNSLTYSLSTLPLFILMGNFVASSRLSDELYEASYAFVGHVKGGLAMATILACGAFSAICGSSLATAATMSRVAMPSMRHYGYDEGFAAGSIAAGGTLGILIPPSVILVLYGILTNTDIGKLLVAGLLPGLVGILCYIAAVVGVARWKPAWAPQAQKSTWEQRAKALSRIWGVMLLFTLVIGGLYLGVFTATEAAGIGAGGSLLFALARRSFSRRQLLDMLVETVRTTAVMFSILIGALIFSNFLEVTGLPGALKDLVAGLAMSPLMLLAVILGIYILLGCLLDSISMIFLTIPIFFPIIVENGIDPIWFGILLVVVIEIGLITPPVGMNVFMLRATLPEIPTGRVFRGVYPFIAADIVRLGVLFGFPAISLILPGLM
jgi:tripartite ATP-independent transporter DctM subunit